MSDPPGLLPTTRAALLRHVAAVQADSRQPSLIAGVVRDGQLVWWGARGRETGRDDGRAPDQDLQYRVGSITKPLTAISVLQCRDAGLLDLDDPVERYLPGAPFGASTLRALLSHSAALPAEPAGLWWERHDDSTQEALFDRVRDQAPVLGGRRELHYSNLGYALLGAVVAQVRRADWLDVVAGRVLAPLGMTRTTYGPTSPHATGWSVHPHTGRLDREPHTDTGAMAPAGQLWSTLHDLARLTHFWVDPDPAVLGADTVQEMATAASAPTGAPVGMYGMGLRVESAASGVRVGQSGSMPGFLAGMVADSAAGLGAVALSNGTLGSTPTLAEVLLDQVLVDEPPLPPLWRPEPVVDGADELVGAWYWGNTPYVLAVRGGWLCLEQANAGRSSRFEPVGADTWRGLDAYFTGETLTVVRGNLGDVEMLNLATYELTRSPNGGVRPGRR